MCAVRLHNNTKYILNYSSSIREQSLIVLPLYETAEAVAFFDYVSLELLGRGDHTSSILKLLIFI